MKQILKSLYSIIPFKKELFTVLKYVWKPSEPIYRHLHFNGVFKVQIKKNKHFKIRHYGYLIENEIFWEGISNGFEKESINIWTKLCENAEVILDIGANTGIYSLIAKSIQPKAKVYAFEPVTRVFQKLQENILLNNFDIIAIEKAVSNNDGVAFIYDTTAEHTYSVTVNKNFTESESDVIKTSIETITLDSFIKEYNLERVDLIKIDVETHEPEVIEGFLKNIIHLKPTILIEILDDEVGQKVNKLIEGLDYQFYNIDEKNGLQKVNKITKSNYFNYLLCSPEIAKRINLV